MEILNSLKSKDINVILEALQNLQNLLRNDSDSEIEKRVDMHMKCDAFSYIIPILEMEQYPTLQVCNYYYYYY